MKYFEGIKTYKELKNLYRKFARQFHPDVDGGDAVKFKEMKKEYDFLFKRLKNVDTDEAKKHADVKYDFMNIIDKLVVIKDADIEIIGSWIWVSNIKANEKEKHATLKSLGFQYSKNRKSWYLGEKKPYWRQGLTKEQMKKQFGYQKITQTEKEDKPKRINKPLKPITG